MQANISKFKQANISKLVWYKVTSAKLIKQANISAVVLHKLTLA